MQTRSFIITPPNKHRILINDFTSYSEAFEAATKKLHAVYPVSPQPRVKRRHPPQEYIFVPAKQALELGQEPILRRPDLYVCLRVLASACVCKGSAQDQIQRCASKFSTPSHRRRASSVFSDSKCLYGASDRGFVQILRGNS